MKDASVLTHVPGRKTPDKLPTPTDRGVAIGDTLGRYLLIDLIGRGAHCTVYRALHQTLNLPVALKVLQLDAGEANRRAYEQLKFEARLLAQLPHPNIVRVYDFEDDPALPYVVLECVEGPSLCDLIQQSGRLALDRAGEIIGQVVDALGALWKLGAVHRDVKPGNILLARDGGAKLADFGQAVLVEEQEIAGDAESPSAAADAISGTAAYLAPEQFLTPSSVDHRSDIYALGATLYHAITGQLPFPGRSRVEVLLKRTREQPPPPHLVVPGMPAEVSEVVLTMMARHADDRYQCLEEVRDALACLTATAAPKPSRPRKQAEPETIEDMAPPAENESERVENAEEAPAARPARRSFWQSVIPRLNNAPEPEAPRTMNEEWLRFVKRTLVAPAARKHDE
jgi:serine/threonine protein kinase